MMRDSEFCNVSLSLSPLSRHIRVNFTSGKNFVLVSKLFHSFSVYLELVVTGDIRALAKLLFLCDPGIHILFPLTASMACGNFMA